MATPLEASILINAQNPAKASSDAGTVEQFSLADQIAADKYLAAKAAVASGSRGLKIIQLVPPGAD